MDTKRHRCACSPTLLVMYHDMSLIPALQVVERQNTAWTCACRALSSVSHAALLKFSTMHNAFGNFTNEVDFTRFFKRMNHLGSVWCCIDAHPGHIHYDFWWDVPHTDKFGRKWERWEPMPGP